MSAEDEEKSGRHGGKGRRRRRGGGGGVNEKRYRTLTCFGLISAECFVLKPLALIWRLQHLELIIRHTPAALQPALYTAITSTPIQTLYSLCAGTYTGVLPAADKKSGCQWNFTECSSCTEPFRWSTVRYKITHYSLIHLQFLPSTKTSSAAQQLQALSCYRSSWTTGGDEELVSRFPATVKDRKSTGPNATWCQFPLQWYHDQPFINVPVTASEHKMVTSTEAFFEYKQPLGKHVEILPLSNKVVEEEAQNAGRRLFFPLGQRFVYRLYSGQPSLNANFPTFQVRNLTPGVCSS